MPIFPNRCVCDRMYCSGECNETYVEQKEMKEELELEEEVEDFPDFKIILDLYLENKIGDTFNCNMLQKYFHAIKIEANSFRYTVNVDDKIIFEYGTKNKKTEFKSITRKEFVKRHFKLN